jgi:hypothetical protein
MTQQVKMPRIDALLQGVSGNVGLTDHIALMVGQMDGNVGSAVPEELVEGIDSGDNSPQDLFGKNAMLTEMVASFRKVNQATRIDAIPYVQSNANNRKTQITITEKNSGVTNEATKSKNIRIVVNSWEHEYIIPIKIGQFIKPDATPDGTSISEKIEEIINGSARVKVTFDNTTNKLSTVGLPPLNDVELRLFGVGGLPTGLVETVSYYVINRDEGAKTFQLSLKPGGVVAAFTTDGTPDNYFVDVSNSGQFYASNGDLSTSNVDIIPKYGGFEYDLTGVRLLELDYDGVEYGVGNVGIELTPDVSGADANPDISGVPDLVEGKRYQTIVWPESYDESVLVKITNDRFNVPNDILDGAGIMSKTDTFANLQAFGTSLATKKCIAVQGNEFVDNDVYYGGATFETSYNQAAIIAATRALKLTTGTVLSNYITTQAALDQFGGPGRAALPYFNTALPDLPIIPAGYGFTDEEISDLNDSGIFIIGNNRNNTATLLGEVYTTYKTDVAGNPDATWGFLEYVDTGSVAREYIFNNWKKQYAQSRMVPGPGLPSGVSAVSPESFRAYTLALVTDLTKPNFSAVQGETTEFVNNNMTVDFDFENGIISTVLVLPIVTQARKIIAVIKIGFSPSLT